MQDVVWALFRGEFERAERLAERALSSGGARRTDADCSYRLAMFLMRREQGRLGEIEALMRDAVDAYPGYRSFRCFIPLLELELGRAAEARRAFDALAARRVRGAARATPSGCSASACSPRWRRAWAIARRRRCSTGCCGPTPRSTRWPRARSCSGRSRASSGSCATVLGRPDDAAGALRGRPRDRRADRRPARGSPTPRRTTPACCASAAARRRRAGARAARGVPRDLPGARHRATQAASGRTGTPASASASLTCAIE